MKKLLSTFLILMLTLSLCLALSACTGIPGITTQTCTHSDANFDGKCDLCSTVIGPAHTECIDNDENTLCDVCGKAVDSDDSDTDDCTHKYDNKCDSDCNKCGEVREITHKYQNDCDPDCSRCGAVRDVTHEYENECELSCDITIDTNDPMPEPIKDYKSISEIKEKEVDACALS